ncbi:MerR family transcriptional regulator [Piscinibacter terrae]|uniref:MerR family transcriptional regulator n=1 Tax=Piscinibacter terrae TaxID=2496871 RepID=A0A3N7JTE5_9BURK|nr:MerR family transcriptional regulator [Albitalea terrae]RQP24219.1 MerR family transcriptional regulator [Albitalea terrae]
MRIGELADRTGLAPSAIRFYEREGLMPAAKRQANGYRVYGEADVERLAILSLSQSFGLSLTQIRTAFDKVGVLAKDRMLAELDARLQDMDTLIKELKQRRRHMVEVRATLAAAWSEGRCVDPRTLGVPR